MISKSNLLLLAPLALVMLLDMVFTLVGQPDYYWQNYQLFNEGSPLGQSLMLNPAYFLLFFAFYIPFVLFLTVNLRRPFNIIVYLVFFLGHAWGSSSWVPSMFYKATGIYPTENWYLIIGYFATVAVISGFCINKWLKLWKSI